MPAGLTYAQIADHIVAAANGEATKAIGLVTVARGTGWHTYAPA